MAEFYSARGWEIPPLPWTNLSPPFSSSLVGCQTIKVGLYGIPFMLVSAKVSQVTFPLIVSGRRRSGLVRRMFMLVWSRELWLGRFLRPS